MQATKHRTVRLRLWVSNQPEGAGGDLTPDYLRDAGMNTLREMQLREDQIDQWARHVLPALERTIAELGHGDGCEDLDPPELAVYLVDEGGHIEGTLIT